MWASMSARKRHILGGVAVCCVGGVAYYLTHLEETPITHRRRFVMFSRKQMKSLLESEKETIDKMIMGSMLELPHDHEMYQLVASIASRIIVRNNLTATDDFKWNLHVLDNQEVVNAVCLPSGDIYVFTGMVHECKNTDELALILSHEIAHAVLGHGLEVMSSRAVADVVSLFVVGLIWSIVPFATLSALLHTLSRRTADILVHYPYSRKLETEADTVGLKMAAGACYNMATAVKVWEHLGVPLSGTAEPAGHTADGKPVPVTSDKNEDLVPEFLSTHPSNAHRYENLVQLLPEANLEYQNGQCDKEIGTFMSIYAKLFRVKV